MDLEYEDGRKRDEERARNENLTYHTVESFNQMIKESNEKWKNVNDKFIDAVTKKQERCYCWFCEKEILGDDLKNIIWKKIYEFNKEYEVALCPKCIEDDDKETQNKYKGQSYGDYRDPEVEGVD